MTVSSPADNDRDDSAEAEAPELSDEVIDKLRRLLFPSGRIANPTTN
jgi:hypothetical protein